MLPVYSQVFTEEDAKSAYEAVRSGFLSSGNYVKDLEDNFASYVKRKRASTCSNGTAALYLALRALNIENSVVAIPACGYVAAAFAASMTHNKIVFIDCENDTWNMDMEKLEEAFSGYDISCVITIHNYGSPVDITSLLNLKSKYNFKLIEDACEALGAMYHGNPIGSFGEVSLFSFYGNKTISCGEGGIIVCDDDEIDHKIKLLKGQGQDPNRRFYHIIKAFNFRLTNLQSAVALSQFSRIDETLENQRRVVNLYRKHLPNFVELQGTLPNCDHSWWMVSIKKPGDLEFYNKMSIAMSAAGIETRPIFPPIPSMDAFIEYKNSSDYNNAIVLNKSAISLPSGPGLLETDIIRVCEVLKNHG